LTVEKLTGMDINYAGLITFDGVAKMADAIGGVEVCVDGPINDPHTRLKFPKAGKYSIQGYQALAFLRSRHGVGDGSDLGRISSQQHYLSSMVRKIQDEGVLFEGHPGRFDLRRHAVLWHRRRRFAARVRRGLPQPVRRGLVPHG
jgi:anionic cell wall polymer biosynthesis LytR-Cps2A-Psr (LCP) family protein